MAIRALRSYLTNDKHKSTAKQGKLRGRENETSRVESRERLNFGERRAHYVDAGIRVEYKTWQTTFYKFLSSRKNK